ncbi:hypothetical protein EDWATA_01521 [Edwardsiella tarda ATCC 23685]|uniref:Uncharacterized protein n=1 Tax=Edwardsiella tarda ATCC 23685 TaxID=500638 RepID=D4F452_EDWTA|nr:hypothetical protein EDWATA_01521 [Edwardsiella tarda ATCC 23685]
MPTLSRASRRDVGGWAFSRAGGGHGAISHSQGVTGDRVGMISSGCGRRCAWRPFIPTHVA